MTAVAPSEVVPSVVALLMLPTVDGADPLLSAMQYKVPPVKPFGELCTLSREDAKVCTLSREDGKVCTLSREDAEVCTLSREDAKVCTLSREDAEVCTLSR